MKVSTIPMDQCVERRMYKLRSRNLVFGVYDGVGGFVGIRQKFDHSYLFTEYHYDNGAPYGTVVGVIDTELSVPDHIQLSTTLGTVDAQTNRPMEFDRPVESGGRGWYFTDTDEDADPKNTRPQAVPNTDLFNFLKPFYQEELKIRKEADEGFRKRVQEKWAKMSPEKQEQVREDSLKKWRDKQPPHIKKRLGRD